MSKNDLERRLQLLEDKSELARLMNRYRQLSDEHKDKEWSELWAEDAVVEMPGTMGNLRGREEIAAASYREMDVFQGREHVITNMEFDVDGDRATGVGVIIFIGVPDLGKPGENFMTGGHYYWNFVRTEYGWRLSGMRLNFFWNNADEAPGSFKIK